MTDLPDTLSHALRRFTRLPGIGSRPASDPITGEVLRAFPLAGIAVALLQGLVYAVSSLLLPHPVAVLLAMATGVVLTGGQHEQGWMRWCRPGALSLPLLLLLRFETLAHIGTDWLVMALVCAAAWSRACAVLLVQAMTVTRRDATIALLIGAIPTLALIAWTGDALTGLLSLACALVATAVVRGIARRRNGQTNGSSMDAGQQLAEVAFLIGLLVALESADLPEEAQDDDS